MLQNLQNAIKLHQQGRLTEAEGIYRQILRQFPNHAETLNAFGLLQHQRGRPKDAVTSFHKAIKSDRKLVHIYLNLAVAQKANGNLDLAIVTLKNALKIKPSFSEAWFFLGNLYHDLQQLNDAIRCYRKVIEQNSNFAPALNCLGIALQESGDLMAAINSLKEAIKIQPNFAEAHLNLANTYYKNNEKILAQEHYQYCLSIAPDLPQAHLGLAQLNLDSLIVSEVNDKSIEKHLLAATPLCNTAEYQSVLGIFNQRKGKWDIGLDQLRSSISLRADPNTIYQYVQGKKFTEDDDEISKLISRLISNPEQFDIEKRALLYFSRGKMLNDLHAYSEAFENYKAGNDLINSTKHYDASEIDEKVEKLKEVFSPALLQALRHPSSTRAKKLVFVVGMPRSGTTLTEQIIASHSQVLGAGELFGLVALEENLPGLINSQLQYPDLLRDISFADLESISSSYLDELENLFPGNHKRLTDKFPLNFWRIGLIRLLFPNSKIIYVKRNALDCCLSNYFQKFADGHDFAFNLQNLGHYYTSHLRVMNHWRNVLPSSFYELQYEDLTADPEYWSRQLIEYIELDWDANCLSPHKLDRSVRTASVWQVRQPIYKNSVQRWKNYESEIMPLIEALKSS